MVNLSISAAQVTLPSFDGSSKSAMDSLPHGQESDSGAAPHGPEPVQSGFFRSVSGLKSDMEVLAPASAAPAWNLPAPDSRHIIAILIGL